MARYSVDLEDGGKIAECNRGVIEGGLVSPDIFN